MKRRDEVFAVVSIHSTIFASHDMALIIEEIQFEYENRPQASSRHTPLPPPVQASQPRREYQPQPQPPQPQPPRQQPLQQPRVQTVVQPTESIDPFESASFADQRALARAQPSPPHVAPMQQQQRVQPLAYSVSTDASSEAHSEDEDEDVDESQLLPGSDLF